MTTFRNEPLLELRRESVRREALEALSALDAKLPLDVPMLIGDNVVTGRRFASVDPSQPTRIVAHAHEATAQHVQDAIASAEIGHKAWSRKSAADRAAALSRAAAGGFGGASGPRP
jgi:delta 1-pyrroline-5-carboxylate dehydrogenase